MSIIDDYEKSTVISYDTNSYNTSSSIEPIFRKENKKFNIKEVITNFLVSNNVLLLFTANRKLIRVDWSIDEKIDIDMKQYLSIRTDLVKLQHMFHSPNGQHSILSFLYSDGTNSAENFYFCRKMHSLLKSKGHVISAVGWNHSYELNQNQNSTSTILIGTNKGIIFETELFYKDENKWGGILNLAVPEQYWKQVYDLKFNEGEKNNFSITEIEFYTINSSYDESITFILVTTQNKIYQFVNKTNPNEELNLVNLFLKSEKYEIPGNLGFSKLDVFYDQNKQPISFGWLVEPGVYYALIDLKKAAKEKSVIDYKKIIPYKDIKNNDKPISLAMTKYHSLVLFNSYLKVICNINGQTIMEDQFLPTYGKAVGITKDIYKNSIWAYSELAIYQYSVYKEDRNIINIYLQQNDFENAKLAAANNKESLRYIYSKEAQFYFENKNYLQSAQLFAQSNHPVDEVALKFMSLEDKSLLKDYLINKLDTLREKDLAQVNILVAWIVEIFMKDLYDLNQEKLFDDDKYEYVKKEFEFILSDKKVLRSIRPTKKILYDLFLNQGDDKNLIFFARAIKDYEYLIEYFLKLNEYNEVLKVLKDSKQKELVYNYSPILVRNKPEELIDVLINTFDKFDFNQLLPTLLFRTTNDKTNTLIMKQLIRYLEHCVFKLKVKDEIVFDYLLTFYGEYSPEKINDLLEFIKENNLNLDLKYILRNCIKMKLYKACVTIYLMMDSYEDAFDYAMLIDLKLAKDIANSPKIDKELKKKLWLKIAKKIIENNNDIQHLSVLLNECEYLNIEDILPFFPEVLTIDLFKESICSSLKSYNTQIEKLRKQKEEISDSIEQVRKEISFFKNNHSLIKIEDNCQLCNTSILIKEFYQFPCKHQFHVNCLESNITKLLNKELVIELKKIKDELADLNKLIQVSQNSNNNLLVDKEKLLAKYDDIISSECFYCSELMINTIDKPLINNNSDQESWD